MRPRGRKKKRLKRLKKKPAAIAATPAPTTSGSPQQQGKRTSPFAAENTVIARPVYKEYPQNISLQSVAKENTTRSESLSDAQNNDFTQQDFDKVWMAFAKAEKSRRPRVSMLLSSKIPQKPENGVNFRFDVSSQTAKDYLELNLREPLQRYLRDNLHNNLVTIRFEMDGAAEPESNGMPYTSKEKYMFMLEKNPALKLLRDAFDLETD